MSIVLGIDTGGTYTDGVIIDLETKEILGATKAPTTHDDLIVGIRNTIKQLDDQDLEKIEYAALSTTLATNAIVEGRGCRVGLLLIGFTPTKDLPPCDCHLLPGVINVRGKEQEPLNIERTKNAIESFRDKVDAVAISGIFSVHNPSHEETVKAMVRDILDLPVVTAHELTTVLGIQERTVTAVLNARLISVIDELMSAVKQVMQEREIDVPIMIVKGDGSLMNETVARERPIETILSGPAASIIGSTFLDDMRDGLVLDMGGTTTDIAILKDGRPRLDREGARVGGWRTRVAAAEASTFGLGGDSRIYLNQKTQTTIVGPMRCWPVSLICRDYPSYLVELKYIRSYNMAVISNDLPEGYFLLRKPPVHMELSEKQRRIIDVLKDGPHTIVNIADKIETTPNFLNVRSLVEHGILGMIGFTPTDLLHLDGEYVAGNVEAAQLAAELMAKSRGITIDDFVKNTRTAITDKLCHAILTSTMDYEGFNLNQNENDKTLDTYFNNAIWQKKSDILNIKYKLELPIIGIGAPIKAWLPQGAEKFDTKPCFPRHNDVANAVGAAAGKVMTIIQIKVQNHEGAGIGIYSPWGQIPFYLDEDNTIAEEAGEDLTAKEIMDKAGNYASTKGKLIDIPETENLKMECGIKQAIACGKEHIATEMERQGVAHYDVLVERRDVKTGNAYNENIKIHIETYLEIIAVGCPQWRQTSTKG